MKKPQVLIGRSLLCAIKEVVIGERWRLTHQFGAPPKDSEHRHDASREANKANHDQSNGHSL